MVIAKKVAKQVLSLEKSPAELCLTALLGRLN
jgi:hypothetical protein